MRVGVLGAGQLAQMLALAGHNLNIDTLCLTDSENQSAKFGSELFVCDSSDVTKLHEFASMVDVVTFENEFISLDIVNALAKKVPVYPSANALKVTQDRLFEKDCFNSLGIDTPKYFAIDSFDDLTKALADTKGCGVLKTRTNGYDGKGQALIKKDTDIKKAYESLPNVPLILESFVDFKTEVSIIAVRSVSGELRFYPLTENHHRDGILRVSQAPYTNEELNSKACLAATKLLKEFDYVGVMAVEFFVSQDGELLANEIAPRVHNSGHWTIEGAVTSQFENHLRAICDLPLGDTFAPTISKMYNVIGSFPDKKTILALDQCHLHDYNKSARSGRKLGHITLLANDEVLFEQQSKTLNAMLEV